jgi:hypothetical protein
MKRLYVGAPKQCTSTGSAMLIVSIDEDGKAFSKFQVTQEDLDVRKEPHDQVIHGNDGVVQFIESLAALENDSSGVDKIERLLDRILEVGVQIGIEKSKKKLSQLLE